MFPQISGKPIKLTCTEHDFPEFPDLLFGRATDNGTIFFDATAYLQTKELSTTVTDFFSKYEEPIRQLANAYGVEESKICLLNHEGHYLIDGNFLYLFISFIDQGFIAYMCDRIHELFSTGFCISDTYILQSVKNRLPKDILKTILENECN